jgi:cellulose biosynthesis protein BcsQ
LTFHLGHALAALGIKTLIVDLDPQCNLTILGIDEERLHNIWQAEDNFIDDFQRARDMATPKEFEELISSPRSVHFLLKPAEDGTADIGSLAPPCSLANNLDLIPGRLTMHLYEDKIASRWSDVYQGDPLAVRTITKPRELAEVYARQYGYEIVIMDTSPSLGALNKVIISTTDGFLIPCMPDMFSLYGVRNIGNALAIWKKQFDTVFHLLSSEKRKSFPTNFVRLLGFTIYNARKYSGSKPWNLATAHYNYAMQIPEAIKRLVGSEIRAQLDDSMLAMPIGGTSVMHSHNTLPAMAQKYHMPIWMVPACLTLEPEDAKTVRGNRDIYEATKNAYISFAKDLLKRMEMLK